MKNNMEKMKPNENSKERIGRFLEDYANNFIGFDFFLKTNGMQNISKMIKGGYRIPTTEDHLKEYRTKEGMTLTIEDEKDPILIEKLKKLDELANKFNSLGENITKEEIEEIIKEVNEIAFN